MGASFWLASIGAGVAVFTSQYARADNGRARLLWAALTALIIAGCMMGASRRSGSRPISPMTPH